MLSQIAAPVVGNDDVLSNYMEVFYASFIVSLIFTPIMRTIAIYFNIIDQPDRVRKLHSEPVAYLGGLAVFLGWLTGVTVSQYLTLHRIDPGWPTTHPKVHFGIVLGALIIVTLGLWDDVLKVRPKIKIMGQVTAAICLLGDGVGARCGQSLVQPLVSSPPGSSSSRFTSRLLATWSTPTGTRFVSSSVWRCSAPSSVSLPTTSIPLPSSWGTPEACSWDSPAEP
jgi:UDP-N-acetylmuramyl pentapeptide phosphotransferase/UDP-N-acetylglucosamine-1-phosphate transferase